MQVIEGGPADLAGLQKGDLLVELDGEPVTDASDLQRLMVHERIGRSVPATILRDGAQRTVTIVLDELAEDPHERAGGRRTGRGGRRTGPSGQSRDHISAAPPVAVG